MPEGGGRLDEIYRLTKENNQMLRAMRRSARLHTIFRLVIYALLVFAALWFYLHYIAPLLLQMLDALNKIQGASNQAHDQLSAFTNTLEKFKAFIPGVASSSAH